MRSALALAAALAWLPGAAMAQLGPARAGSLAQADNAATASLTFVQGGDGKIDQQATPLSGRLVGEFTQRRTFLLSVALVWDR